MRESDKHAAKIASRLMTAYGQESFRKMEAAWAGVGSDPGVEVFESGARRSAVEERYDLIPTAGLKAMARTMARGAKTYGEGNWQKGIPISDLLNHCLRHLVLYQEGDTTENHLAHAACNLMMALHFQEHRQT